MKKPLAIILTAILLCGIFGGMTVGADNPALEDALALAKPELYGMYTEQSAKYLRDSYDRAEALLASGGTDNGETAALTAAVAALAELEGYTHSPLNGFSALTADDIAAMKYIKGSASLIEDGITLTGTGTLQYSNASSSGIVGASPFAIEMIACDGLVLHISADTPATLDLTVGKRGSAADCEYYISDIAVTGDRDYFFPFEEFGEGLSLDGTLNYISLRFEGASEVSFGGLHAAKNSAETAKAAAVYSETPVTAPVFDSAKYYKIYQKDTDLALTFSEDAESDTLCFTAATDGDATQEWQIVRDTVTTGRFRIINRSSGKAVQIRADSLAPSLQYDTPDMTDTSQEWSITRSGSRGFSIVISGLGRLSYSGSRARAAATTTAAKYFDICELPADEWNLAWSDEFDFLDRNIWRVMNAKNRGDTEPMFNRDSENNLYIEDGNLVIRTIVEEYSGYHATSAYLETDNNLFLGHGLIEMRAKLPEGNKIWPALWMMGGDDGWPFCGEIDIVEMVGSTEADNFAGDRGVIGTAHTASDSGVHISTGGHNGGILYNDNKLSEEYHTYAVEWDSDYIRWYWDGMLYFCMNIDEDSERWALINNPMYLILDTSIEGPGDNLLPEGLPDESRFYVDYIKYYKKNTDAAPDGLTPASDAPIDTSTQKTHWGPQLGRAAHLSAGIYLYATRAPSVGAYNMNTFTTIGGLKGSDGLFDNVLRATISHDASKYAFSTYSGYLFICDSDFSPDSLIQITTRPTHCPHIAFNTDGSQLIAGSRADSTENTDYGRNLHVFSVSDGSQLYEEFYDSYISVILSASNGKFAVGCYDGTLRLYNSDFTLAATLAGHSHPVTSLVFSDDGSRLYSADTEGRIYSFNTADGNGTAIPNISRDEIYALALSPDGSRLGAACADFCARIFDTESGRLISRPALGDEGCNTVAFSLDGKLFAAAGNDGFAVVCSARDGRALTTLSLGAKSNGSIDFLSFNTAADGIFASIRYTPGGYNNSGAAVSWRLPGNLLPTEADTSALNGLLTAKDEALYTPESYAAYYSALSAARVAAANPYSSQAVIDSAAAALNAAAESLTEAPQGMLGDMDGDEEITVADALAALRIAARIVEATPEDIAAGDTDGDGRITVADALAILRVAADLAVFDR